MSEHQYYEFAAVDRPLTTAEMAALRAMSTRAAITPSGFVNHYHWGDLNADPADWMRRYFDAFVYTANWGSCRLALRVPRSIFDATELEAFATQGAFSVEAGDGHWIFGWSFDDESEARDRFETDDGSGWMGRLLPLRDELLRGDLRPLYLGWLAGAGAGEVPDDGLEPDVPPGLRQLSAAQQALATFLAVDADLLAAAAAGSAPLIQTPTDAEGTRRLDDWLDGWPREELTALVGLMLRGREHEAQRHVRSRHAAWLKQQQPAMASAARRSFSELCVQALAAARLRLEHEAEGRTRQQAQQRRQREAFLAQVLADADRHWRTIEEQAERGVALGYDAAVRGLADLAEAHALAARSEAFQRALQRFLERHGKRKTLMTRLAKAGLAQP